MTELLVPMSEVQIENFRKLEKARKALKEGEESSVDLVIAEMSFRGVTPQVVRRTPGWGIFRPFIRPLRIDEHWKLTEEIKPHPKTGKLCLVYDEKSNSPY